MKRASISTSVACQGQRHTGPVGGNYRADITGDPILSATN